MGLFDKLFGGKPKPTADRAMPPPESPEERRARELRGFLQGNLQYNARNHPYSHMRRLDLGRQLGISGIETLLDLTPEAIRVKYNSSTSGGNVPVEEVLAAIAADQQSVKNFLNATNRSQDNALTDTLIRPWLNYAVALGYTDGNRPEGFPDYKRADAVAKANPDAMKRIFSLAMKHIAVTPFSARTIEMMGYIPYGSQKGVPPTVTSDAEFLRDTSGFVLKNLEQGVFLPWVDAMVELADRRVPGDTSYDFKTGIRPYQLKQNLAPAVADVVKQHILARDGIVETKFAEQATRR